jgi:hypothetical protein
MYLWYYYYCCSVLLFYFFHLCWSVCPCYPKYFIFAVKAIKLTQDICILILLLLLFCFFFSLVLVCLSMLLWNTLFSRKSNQTNTIYYYFDIIRFLKIQNCRWFSLGTPVSSINKTDRRDINEISLKVALTTIKQTNKQTNNSEITNGRNHEYK